MKLSNLSKMVTLLVVSGGFVQLFLANSYCLAGEEVAKLEKEKKMIAGEVNTLGNLVASFSSLATIEERASKLGLVAAFSNLEFLTPSTVALRTNATP